MDVIYTRYLLHTHTQTHITEFRTQVLLFSETVSIFMFNFRIFFFFQFITAHLCKYLYVCNKILCSLSKLRLYKIIISLIYLKQRPTTYSLKCYIAVMIHMILFTILCFLFLNKVFKM